MAGDEHALAAVKLFEGDHHYHGVLLMYVKLKYAG
jgi:hypothetical protein